MLTLNVNSQAAANEENTFTTINGALSSIPSDFDDEIEINIHPGTYNEKVDITFSNIRIVGKNASGCMITCNDYEGKLMADGTECGVMDSYTVKISGDNAVLENLTIRNSHKPSAKSAGAIALCAAGDNITVTSCRIEGYKNTLCTGTELKKPQVRQVFTGCYICGDYDFIFGYGSAYFENCKIASVYTMKATAGSEAPDAMCGCVASPVTFVECKYGYVFNGCRFMSICPDESVYIGRPDNYTSKIALIDCSLGSHINKSHFYFISNEIAKNLCFYGEYGSYGDGAVLEQEDRFVKHIKENELRDYTKRSFTKYKYE